jgi:chromosome segregation ATPase
MKSSKKPSKEPSLPSQDEARRANVLMEQMLSKFDTFGESLSAVRERVERIEPKIDKLTERVDVLESAVRIHTHEIRSLKEGVQGNTLAIHAMHAEFKSINQRLEVVEAKS